MCSDPVRAGLVGMEPILSPRWNPVELLSGRTSRTTGTVRHRDICRVHLMQ